MGFYSERPVGYKYIFFIGYSTSNPILIIFSFLANELLIESTSDVSDKSFSLKLGFNMFFMLHIFCDVCWNRDGWRNRLAENGVTREVTTRPICS